MEDLRSLMAPWQQTVQAVVDLGRGCDERDFATPTECPGWTVQDQLSHVVGIELWMAGEPEPDHAPPAADHVRTELGRRVEVAVDLRRGRPGREVVEELAAVLARRLEQLADPAVSPEDETVSPLGGVMPLADVLRMRTFDVHTHEQDVRRALGRPGGLDTPAAGVALAWLRRGLGRVVARGARTEPGRVVVLDVEGPGGFTDAVAVEAGPDRRSRGTVLPQPPERADAVLRLSTEAFLRRSCGRWPAEATPVRTEGDAALAARVLEALAVTP